MSRLIWDSDAIDALATYIHHVDRAIGTGKLSDQQCVESAHSIIDELPSAERKGKWIEKEDPYGFFNSIPVCSECGCTTKMRERYNYCPNCGADMRGDEDERPNKQHGDEVRESVGREC